MDSSEAVQDKFNEVFIIRNKIFVTREDFHFDLQRFADNVTYLDANGTLQTVSNVTTLTESTTTLNAGWYVVNSNLTINSVVTINGEVHLIIADGAKLTINGGKITDNSYCGIKACNFHLNWRNADDFIKTNKLESSNIAIGATIDDKIKISDGKRFYEENGNIYSGNITSEQFNYLNTAGAKTLKPVDGYIVTIFDGMNVTSGNLTRIGTTNKYICAAGTELTLSTGDSTNFYKFNGIKGATADGNTYKYTVNGDSTLELDGFPKITGLTFNESEEYYEIGTTDALIALASYVNEGHDCAGLKFKLTADIEFNYGDFAGIGTATTAFNGKFIGDDQYSISYLSNCVFNYIDDGANISGLKVYGSNIQKSCGIIVDNMLGGEISDCTVKGGGVGSFSVIEYAGNIVGNGTGG